MATRGRKPNKDVSPKQLEVYELVLNYVRENGFQPTIRDLCKLLNIETPACRGRIQHLIAKGYFKKAPPKAERCLEFVGVKFLPYQVDPATGKISEEQEFEVDDYVVTFKRKQKAVTKP